MSFSAEATVYLACRAIFTGQNAQLRKQKKIRELIEKRKASLSPLLAEFNIAGVVDIVKRLLDNRIFESDFRAKEEFPELFLSCPERIKQRADSENIAARSVKEALEEIESSNQSENELDERDGSKHFQELSEDGELSPVHSVNKNLPSLYPSLLPYKTQHEILTTVQYVLEECFFDFFKCWKPSILSEIGWDCAEAGELTKWTRILSKHSGKIPSHAFALEDGHSLNDVLFSTHKLRHTAVHRLPTTARGVIQLIDSARNVTATLKDVQRTAQLEELLLEAESKVNAMELNKNVLEDELARELQHICQQRKELETKEECLREMLSDSDIKNRLLVGSLLEDSMRKIFSEGPKSNSAPGDGGQNFKVQGNVKENGWRYYMEFVKQGLGL